jgi:hypothetical protein
MSRKKSPAVRPAPTSVTAVVSAAIPQRPAVQTQDRFWLEVVVVRLARWLGSLQLAVLLLTLFAVVLTIGTLMESWYDGKVAQQLVYQAWWFTALLAFLGVNIFFAAAKKWPWKKHQTGFLITHVGLLTMVSGGILNSLGGTDALMVVVDSENPASRRFGPRTTSRIMDRTVSTIQVKRPHTSKDEVQSFFFEPGPLPWRPDEYLQPKVDFLAGVLNWLGNPLPQGWARDIAGGARLEVLAFYPHARQESFGPAKPGEQAESFPAINFRLTSPMAGSLPDDWVALRGRPVAGMGPAQVEMLGNNCPDLLIEEFLHPPRAAQVKKAGELVLWLGNARQRIDVDAAIDHVPTKIGNTGWSFKLLQYLPDPDGGQIPSNPSLIFEMQGPEAKSAKFAIKARSAGDLFPLKNDHQIMQDLKDLHGWYHPPDYRWGEPNVRAMLQLVIGENGAVYYRSFNSHKGPFDFEKSGTLPPPGEPLAIWEGMNWKFRVVEYLPHAAPGPRFIPVDRRLGLEDEEMPAVIRCRLSAGKESKEFWVPKTEGSFTSVTLGKETYQVGFNTYLRNLDFDITLLRAEQTSDPGTQQPASYTSFVLLTDKRHHIEEEPRVITMNQPLDYDGYKLYQSGYNFLGMDENSKPVSRSVFTVGRDPGLWMKYLGSTMLALGIACMFYMKAYFFKPRRRPGLAAAAVSGSAGEN